MKKIVRKCLACLLAVAIMISCGITAFAADSETVKVQAKVTYGQTEARSMLKLINDFRTGENAWYWNADNNTKTTLSGLQGLTYDYELEKIAMQRAAEIALYYSHTRPNGSSCFTAYGEYGYGYTTLGENIAAGYKTAEAVFTGWQEEDKKYDGQGHRRNMLSQGFTAVGIGHVQYNGVHYWVQEFAKPSAGADTTATAANDEATKVNINVSSANISSMDVSADKEALNLDFASDTNLPGISASLQLTENWPGVKCSVTVEAVWNVASGEIAEISGEKLVAKKAGETTLITTVLGQTISVPVIVNPISLEKASISLDKEEYQYNGKPITPVLSVTLNGVILKEEEDYTVEYSKNTAVGEALAVITGKGNYTGSLEKTFTISPCVHQWDEGKTTKTPTCTAEGEKAYTCTACGEIKTETIEKIAHTQETIPAVKATCTETGLTEGIRCSVCGTILEKQETIAKLPHEYQENVKKQPTCTEDGEREFVCAVCGDQYIESIASLGHNFNEWETITASTCTEEGEEQRSCTVCQYTESRGVAAAGHVWADEYTIDEQATCETDGSKSIHCKNCSAVKESEVIPAYGHDWKEETIINQPTCTETGLKEYICGTCGEKSTEIIPAMGHSYGEWTVVAESSCTKEGSEKSSCTVCGHEETRSIPVAEHEWETEYTIDQPAACEDVGSKSIHCKNCEAVKESEVIPATGHMWNDGVVTKQPICNAEGEIIYTCTVCHEAKTEIIEKLSHKVVKDPAVAPTKTSTGLTEGSHCSVCGEVIVAQKVLPVLTDTNIVLNGENGATLTVVGDSQYYDSMALVVKKEENAGEAEKTVINALGGKAKTLPYEIHLERKGKVCQPEEGDVVTIVLPIPEGWDAAKTLVYHVDNGKLTNMNGVVDKDNRTISFTTSHFSTYVLAQKVDGTSTSNTTTGTTNTNTSNSPHTGDSNANILWVFCCIIAMIGCEAALVEVKKRLTR